MSNLPSAPVLASGRLAAPTAKLFVLDEQTEDVLRRALIDIGVDDAEFTRGTVETATAALAREATPRLLVVDISGVRGPADAHR